jgi:hypothetical protein
VCLSRGGSGEDSSTIFRKPYVMAENPSGFVRILPKPSDSGVSDTSVTPTERYKRPRVTRACIPCSTAKRKCGTLERPCDRCKALGLESQCIDKDPTNIVITKRKYPTGVSKKHHPKRKQKICIQDPSGEQLRPVCLNQQAYDVEFIPFGPHIHLFGPARPQRSCWKVIDRIMLHSLEFSPLLWSQMLSCSIKRVSFFVGVLGCYLGNSLDKLKIMNHVIRIAQPALELEHDSASVGRRIASIQSLCLPGPISEPPSVTIQDDESADSPNLVQMNFTAQTYTSPMLNYYVNLFPYTELFPLPFLKDRVSANLYLEFRVVDGQMRVETYFNEFAPSLWGYSPGELEAILKEPPARFVGDQIIASGLLK